MSTLVKVLDTPQKGLVAQQAGLNVTGHNIANVNTAGDSRQRVILEPSLPESTVHGLLGSGVQVQRSERIRDEFIDSEIRTEQRNLGRWEFNESTLPFRWLICVENPRLMFPVVDPKMVNPEYSLRIGSEDGVGDLFAIVTIGDSIESVTVNLQAPVVIDGQTRLGKQVILTDSNYPIRYRAIQ